MTKDEPPDANKPRKRLLLSEAERREAIERLVQCHRPLTADETDLFRAAFGEVYDAHCAPLQKYLQRRGLQPDDAEQLLLDSFSQLFIEIVDHGFPDVLAALLHRIAVNKLLNYLTVMKRTPESVALPSSSSEIPRSGPASEIERLLDRRANAAALLPQLKPEHRALFELVFVNRLLLTEAIEALGIPAGTMKSRMIALRKDLLALGEQFAPLSKLAAP